MNYKGNLIRNMSTQKNVDFDQFFVFMSDFIEKKKSKYHNLDFETEEKEATCNICISYEDNVR